MEEGIVLGIRACQEIRTFEYTSHERGNGESLPFVV